MEKYKKIKLIGKGNYGVAILVQNQVNQEYMIIKIINIQKIDKNQCLQTGNEIQILQKLDSPFIIKYYESFIEKDKYLCIVQEYADNQDLYELIQKQKQMQKRLTEQDIMFIFVQICLGLKQIHDKNIIHRDLKSQNIFLNKNNEIKIGDFGISKILDSQNQLAQTLIGTPYYISPEICRENGYDYKTDIWCLGCILYELTTYMHVYDSQTIHGLMNKIKQYPVPTDIPKCYSDNLKDLISILLQKNPKERPTINELLENNQYLNKYVQVYTSFKIKQMQNNNIDKQNDDESKSQQDIQQNILFNDDITDTSNKNNQKQNINEFQSFLGNLENE